MTSATHRVFVYGTLKTNEPNNDLIKNRENGQATLLGKAVTNEKHPLVIASKYNIPFVLDKPGCGNHIKGEVYEIDDEMLRNFDELEECPTFYTRQKIWVTLSETKERTEAWIYVLPSFKPELLELPYLVDYSSSGPHGLIYKERAVRIPGYHAREDVRITDGNHTTRQS